MGHQQSRGNQYLTNTIHSKFGKVSFPKPIFSTQFQKMRVQIPCDQVRYKNWNQNLKDVGNTSNTKYLLLPVNHKYYSGGLCANQGITKVTYQKLPYILEDQILAVKDKKHTFSEPQIWKLLYIIVSAKNQYLTLKKTSSLNLGNINPKNIFLNQEGSVKVGNPLSWPNDIDGYRRALLKEPSYLSPQDMNFLQLGSSNNDTNIHSEQFSIGMTLLSTGLAENLQNLYNFETKTMNKQLFEQKLMLWKTTLYYSQILRAIVLCLLESEPSKRINFRQITQFLHPHSTNIEAQKPLTINNSTRKIDNQIQKLRNQIEGLLRYRFEKYSTENFLQLNQKSLPIQSRKIPPKNTIRSTETMNKFKVQVNQAGNGNQQQTNTITKVKSLTKFTYSNLPFENVPSKQFVVVNPNQINIQNLQSGNYAPPSISYFAQQNPLSPRINNEEPLKKKPKIFIDQEVLNSAPNEPQHLTIRPHIQKQVQIVDEIFPPHFQKLQENEVKSSAEIAQKLIKQGLIHTDSEIYIEVQKKQSIQTEINKLQSFNHKIKSEANQQNIIFQKKQNQKYQIYSQILIKCDFQTAWIEYLSMIKRPDFYFHQLQNKVTLADSKIEIPPGKLRLEANKEEGKIQLSNMSEKCKGQILGGVSKISPNQMQIWFNSSYTYKDKPFPPQEYFVKSLQLLKKKLQ